MDRPLKFPCKAEDCATFKVDVFDLLGTARLAYRPDESEYSLALDPPDEAAPPRAMEVAFSIHRLGESRYPDSGDDRHLSGAEEERALDEKRELSAREYLEKHGLTSFMQFLMQSLMKDKPSDPYQFLQKQVTKRMVSELSKRACGDGEESALSTVLSHDAKGPPAVSAEQLADLEQQAAAASEQLRLDNKRLRESAAQLKLRYWQLLEEGGSSVQMPPLPVLKEDETVEAPPPAEDCGVPQAGLDETPQMAAYRDIAAMQGEVCSLAKENGSLVEELGSMRAAIDSVRDEIESLRRKQDLTSPT